ncbi:zinc finger protein 62-like [Sitodiplosis mosellana]|uniref:zinc finger protein 62-like n=1 Tax=Sitodiplosis mosellana TaxID=263140 RepID=UPI0024438421|nr:zinc finger protein 62-like [Sitodiplosis mosellana]
MSFEQKSCLFCLNEKNDGIVIFGQVGKALNVWEVIVKYFWFDLLHDVESATTFVCSDCWLKVKSFHEFYLMVEALHNKCASEIGEEPQMNACDEEEENRLYEYLIGGDEVIQSPEKFLGLEIDVLDYGTNTCETTSCQETERGIESYLNSETGVELDIETELRLDAEHIPATPHKRLQTIKIHEIIPFQGEEIPEDSMTRPKRARLNGSKRQIDDIVCYMCHESFSTCQALRKHFLLHDQEKTQQFICQTCEKIFASEILLKHHMENVHERQRRNKKNYHDTICPICEEVMKFGNLKSHIELVHKVIPQKKEKFVCKVCAKIYTSSDAFTKHAWTHMNEDLTRVQCNICEKWLKNQHILNVHKKNHEKIPMKCPHCKKTKFSVISLRSHIAAAHSTRKYQCTRCNKSFGRPIALKEHMAVHTGVTLYNCSYCSKPFRSNANMYKHMRELHTERWNIDRAMKRQK